MNAITLTPNGKIKQTKIEDYYIQNADDVIVKVKSAGLCGSDMHKINSQNKPLAHLNNLILGHEISGQVNQVGDEVTNIHINDRVVIMPLFYDLANPVDNHSLKIIGAIGRTVNGGFAEYVKVPKNHVFKINNNLSLDAAALTDIVAVALHSYTLSERPIGKKIAIIGDGSIGLSCLQIFSYFGNEVDVFGKHNELLVNTLKGNYISINNATESNSYDIIVETVGRSQSDTINKAIHLAKPQGKIVFEGVFPEKFQAKINIREALYKELIMQGANSYQPSEFLEALSLMELEKINMDKLITHRFPLSEFMKGVTAMNNKSQSKAVKVIYTI
ncbi:MAG: zinc-dependent alcohol dehydrogenase [Candidatus Nanoarchaeia archaeon]